MYILACVIIVVLAYYFRKTGRDNIKKYIELRGGKLISQEYASMGRGWPGGKREAVYKIAYRDKDGNLHESWAKSSAFTGVYFSEDTIVEYSDQKDQRADDLEEENARLKTEIERLRKKKTDGQFKAPPFYKEKEAPEQAQNAGGDPYSDDSPYLPTRISAYDTEAGELIIEQRSAEIETGDNVFLNGNIAPDGQYKLGFIHYIYVRNGRISKII